LVRRLLYDGRDRLSWLRDEIVGAVRNRRGRVDTFDDLQARLQRERDRSGNRFYSQPGFAVLLGEAGVDPSGYDGDTGDAMARARSALGEELDTNAELGQALVRDASYGRGAEGWTAVVEWTLEAAAQGVVGLIATAPILAAARRYQALKRRGHLDIRLVPGRERIAETLLEVARPGDLVLTLGAGDIHKSADEFLGLLRSGAPVSAVH